MNELENITYIKNIQERLKDKEDKLADASSENIDSILIKEINEDLNLLKNVKINKNILKSTKIGITVNKFTKINNEEIQNLAKELVEKWKNIALNEKISNIKNIENIKKRKSEIVESGDTRSDEYESKKIKAQNDSNKNYSLDNSENNDKEEQNNCYENNVEKQNDDTNGINTDGKNNNSNFNNDKNIKDHKITDLKTLNEWNYEGKLHNDVHRDKAKQFLFKAFLIGSSDNLLYIIDRKKLNEIIYDIENELQKYYIQKRNSQREYNMQLKSIKFNLSDKKNPNFNEKIYKEIISPKELVTMNSQDMASDEKKNEREKCLQESLIACQSDWDVKNILLKKSRKGEFQCYKCKGYDTIYHQLQTRSSDEPMTTFVTCLKCNNRWKF
ncbi:transcription elongation factor s-II, putative [Plasmodium gallinaceum]|uniref:Transcription elongation factor s-II, putative n=1 Tax=Plasmodium gallinaceum TaxID=5849 RepID=A0A1J1H287_PLAGA|nr:transcription elongation factor s-II, putative [Plasmodium gallinaceum]CRG97619.1 transcription elongation factor s-II, putative [Plasmodium gallinaceum]